MHVYFAHFFSFAILFFAIDGFAQSPDLHDRLAACAACHGEHGEGKRGAEYYPHLAGKPAGYLFDQLQGFRDGRRVYPQMVSLVQYLDDAYFHDIADYYAAQTPRLRAADNVATSLSAAMQARAEQLVQHGDAAAGMPACSACHGADLTGLEPGIPALVGLPADYIVAQLGGWQNGVRHSTAPDCMANIAGKLSSENIIAVAAWLSQQSFADVRRPAAAGTFVPPLACGHLPFAQAAP